MAAGVPDNIHVNVAHYLNEEDVNLLLHFHNIVNVVPRCVANVVPAVLLHPLDIRERKEIS
jgi:hypothetical protein